MVKAIFFDIDGTLVSFKNHQISQSTFDALYKLKEKGIKLFIATGRGKDGLDVFFYFMMTDEGIKNFDKYLMDFKGIFLFSK